jgi:hypothetical protein
MTHNRAFFKRGRRSVLITAVAMLLSLGVLVAACTDDGETEEPVSDVTTEQADENEPASDDDADAESEPVATPDEDVAAENELISSEDVDVLQEDIIRRVNIEHGGHHHGNHHVEVSVVWGTLEFFEQMMPEATERWTPDQGFVFLLSYAVHEGELPDDLPEPELVLEGETFEPEEVEEQQSHPHHLTTIARFPVTGTEDVRPVLNLDDQTMDWGESEEIDYGQVTEQLESADIYRVGVEGDSFAPNDLELTVGEPVVLVFDNRDGDAEHHFHAMGIEPDTLFWLRRTAEMSPDDETGLRSADPLPFHLCSSEQLCPTGHDIHTHAGPGDWDAIFFVPDTAGEHDITNPLNQDMTGTIRIIDA